MRLGTPGADHGCPAALGGELTTPVPPGFQGFAYLLDGQARAGANRRTSQLVLLGAGEEVSVTDATPGTRFMLMAGKASGDSGVQRAVRGLGPRPAGAVPGHCAQVTAWVQLAAPSLPRRWVTWLLTVSTVTTSSRAIAWLGWRRPAAEGPPARDR